MKPTQFLSTFAVAALAMAMLAASAFATGNPSGGYDGDCNLKVKKERAYWYRDSDHDEGKFVACHEGYLPISCMIQFPDRSHRNTFFVHEGHPHQSGHEYGCFFRVGSHDYQGHQNEFETWTVCIPESCVDQYAHH
jgi:hypothetical protein